MDYYLRLLDKDIAATRNPALAKDMSKVLADFRRIRQLTRQGKEVTDAQWQKFRDDSNAVDRLCGIGN